MTILKKSCPHWFSTLRSIPQLRVTVVIAIFILGVLLNNDSGTFFAEFGSSNIIMARADHRITSCPAYEPFLDSSTPKVAIVGAAGYIGSALQKFLREQGYANVRGFDRNPRATKFEQVVQCPIRVLDDRSLAKFDVVVYLGGLTGRKECEMRTRDEVEEENVQDILRLANRMTENQFLVFASTSAIAEGSGAQRHAFTETDAPDPDAMDVYTESLFRREVVMRELAAQHGYRGPWMVALRFGTVVGVSPSQKTEYVHVGMVRSALIEGRITVRHPETWRAFLWINDQARAFEKLISSRQSLWDSSDRFSLFHLSSFNSMIGQAANEVAMVVGVPQTVIDHHQSEDSPGFLLDSTSFQQQFAFNFEGSPRIVVEDLVAHHEHVMMGREILDHEQHVHDYVPCRVCGSHDMMEVLDLGEQPLANDFRPTKHESHRCERHPLRLMRCRKCNHAQLSTMVDRDHLFSNYSYRSATSRTLDDYFHWLAGKVDEETQDVSPSGGNKRRVLELACNDGTQLNHFKELGWETYGVDPASNLVPYARELGHTVWNEMWGASHARKYIDMPSTFDAILAQNVLAHVPNPVDFLAGCVERMHDQTRVYMQTSQCEMFADGQFDTVYHEHISFFSPRSFRELAERVGLKVVRWEITPIHGGSCLVTMMKTDAAADDTLPRALQLEEDRGQLQDAYFVRYRAQAKATRDWLNSVLEGMYQQGHDVVGYGAAAKGMVLLHFLLSAQPKFKLSYVVDDAPLKQNTYCPGTSIPVKPTTELAKHSPTRPLSIIVFSWNFWKEIRGRIVEALNGAPVKHDAVWVILPFPIQEVVVLRGDNFEEMVTLQTNPYRAPKFSRLAAKHEHRPTLGMVTHFFNEELLLPYFIRHHAGVFDEVILIDSGSNDQSRQIIDKQAPSSWRVVESGNPDVFDAWKMDEEVMREEGVLATSWRMTLTTTEFVVHPDLRSELRTIEASNGTTLNAMQFPALKMVGDDTLALKRFPNLVEQRSQVLREDWVNAYSRFVHQLPKDAKGYYSVGRHSMPGVPYVLSKQGYIAKWMYTPWPESISRKMQIGPRIPEQHLAQNAGIQHKLSSTDELGEVRDRAMREHGVADLRALCGASIDTKWAQVSNAWYQIANVCPVYKMTGELCRL